MENIFELANKVMGAIGLILTGLTMIFLLVPGEQPEKTFQKISDLLAKFSRK